MAFLTMKSVSVETPKLCEALKKTKVEGSDLVTLLTQSYYEHYAVDCLCASCNYCFCVCYALFTVRFSSLCCRFVFYRRDAAPTEAQLSLRI